MEPQAIRQGPGQELSHLNRKILDIQVFSDKRSFFCFQAAATRRKNSDDWLWD
jgi:hypothetical protein